MLRSQTSRFSLPARRIANRRFNATYPPPPSGQPAPNPVATNKKDSTLLYTGLGLAGAAGAYYYFSSTDKAAELEKKARHDADSVKVNARQTVDATKDTAHDVASLGRAKTEKLGDDARAKADEARAKWDSTKRDARQSWDSTKEDARQSWDTTKQDTRQRWDGSKTEAQEKWGSTKAGAERDWDETKARLYDATHDVKPEEGRGLFDRAEDGMKRTKEETEAMYRSTRDTAEHKAEEHRRDAQRKGENVKEGWFSWLGYGKSKVSEAERSARERQYQVESDADRLKREAARGVANAAEDVRVRAEKHV